nr:hypothetical protein [Tanacetum cinerariifolium]
AIVKAKSINGEVHLQALEDGKKVILTESIVRKDLQLEDAKSVDCLPNATIFEQLTLMRFVQVFLDKKLEGMSTHNGIYVPLSYTKKVFGNIKRVGKGFSGRETPLFPTMMVQAQEEMGEDEAVNKEMDDSLVRAATTGSSLEVEQDSGGGPRVLDLENTMTTQALEIDSLKRRVKKLEKKQRSRTHKLKRLYKVGFTARVDSSNKASLGEDTSKQDRIIDDINADEEITLVNENAENRERFNDQEDAKIAVDEVCTATTTIATIDDITLAKALMEIKSAKPKATTASTRPKAKGLVIHEQKQAPTPSVSSQQPSQVKVLDKGKGKMVEPEPTELVVEISKDAETIVTEGSSKRAVEELEQENAKKQKMEDDKKSAELKQLKCLKILIEKIWKFFADWLRLDLRRLRIEQYFQEEDYALRDVIENGNSFILRNKPDLDTMSFDDLYNNFKIVEQEVKGTINSSLRSSSQNMPFVSSPSSTNEVDTAYGVSTANTQVSPTSTQVSIASTQVSTANLSDATVYALLASQPNGNRNQDNSRRTVNVEETASNAMVAIDRAGFDWSYMADDEVPTNMALMAFSDSRVYNVKTCSKTCLESFETLKT